MKAFRLVTDALGTVSLVTLGTLSIVMIPSTPVLAGSEPSILMSCEGLKGVQFEMSDDRIEEETVELPDFKFRFETVNGVIQAREGDTVIQGRANMMAIEDAAEIERLLSPLSWARIDTSRVVRAQVVGLGVGSEEEGEITLHMLVSFLDKESHEIAKSYTRLASVGNPLSGICLK